jgi:hypothetical protein
MFKAITWPQYLGAVTLLIVLYYLYVGLVYYRAELAGLISRKGKAAGNTSEPNTPTSLLNRGPLIPKAAVVLPVPVAAPVIAAAAEPDEDLTADENEEEVVADVSAEASDEVEVEAQPELAVNADQEAVEQAEQNQRNDFIEIDNSHLENSVNFTEPDSNYTDPASQSGVEEMAEEFEADFTVGVSQLNSYFDRAAGGEITQEQLVKEVPALANTDVLMAFFKSSTKSAQQLTAATYANVTEPALN